MALAVVDEAQAYVDENIGNLSTEALRDLSESLTKANDALKAIQAELDLLAPPLADLSAGLDAIGAAIDSGLTNLSGAGASLDQIASGKAQISAGLGQASDDVKAYIAEVVALAQATAEEAGDAAAEAEAQLNTVKAEMAGLLGRMAESPLPYGGGFNTAYAPAGDTQAVTDASIALLPNDEPAEETDGIVHTRRTVRCLPVHAGPRGQEQAEHPVADRARADLRHRCRVPRDAGRQDQGMTGRAVAWGRAGRPQVTALGHGQWPRDR